MGAADSIPKFFDPQNPPIPGGWHYWLDPETKQFPIGAHRPDLVMRELQRYRQNNRLPNASEEEIERELWAFWCTLQPERCGSRPGIASPAIVTVQPSKEVWGPILWRFMHLAAANYSHTFFHAMIAEVRTRLILCPNCQAHFDELLAQYPASKVTNTVSACRWTLEMHNAVNRSLGKRQWTYAECAMTYGYPQP